MGKKGTPLWNFVFAAAPILGHLMRHDYQKSRDRHWRTSDEPEDGPAPVVWPCRVDGVQ